MSDSPVIHADIGDGKRRPLFLGVDELRQIKKETGRGWFTIFNNLHVDGELDEVQTVIRLALVGAGESPKTAADLVGYYCAPPRPLRDAYLVAAQCLGACFNGYEGKPTGGPRLSVEEMDRLFTDLEAMLIKGGKDTSVLRGKSFAEVQDLLNALRDDGGTPAPDAETFNAIKASVKKAKK